MSSPVPPPAAPGSAAAPVVEFVAARRTPVAVALLALGVLSLAAAGYCLVKGYGTTAPTADGADPAAIAPNPFQTEYLGGGIAGLLGAAAGLVLGGGLLARLKPADADAARREARWTILLAGGLFGLAVIFLGNWLFGTWFDVIAKWVNDRDASQAWKPLTALLLFLAGAGLAFAAVQPARAEERNNADLRRLCYGLNFGLSAVLLVVGLVVANIVVGLKLPAQLDTTDEGFYSLDPLTSDFVAGLTQDVTVYSNFREEESRQWADVNRMLDACRQVNPARFKVRRVLTADKALLKELGEKFKGVDFRGEPGLLIATGPKESQYSQLRWEDLFSRGDSRKLVFQGEGKLVNELLFLADNKTRPVVYFTQGGRELQLERAAGVAAEVATRSCGALKDALLRNYIDARPLNFDPQDPNPKVPDDASLVVVADPVGPLSAPTLTALKAYMTTPNRDGKKGRLIVLAGLHPKAGGGSHGTNLNELTTPFGVTFQDKLIYAAPTEEYPPDLTITAPSAALARERNPITVAIRGELPVPTPRLMDVPPPGGPARVFPLLLTLNDRYTWLETAEQPNSLRTWGDVVAAVQRKDGDVIAAKNLTRTFRPVAAVASDPAGKPDETETPRLVAFGFSSVFSDEVARSGDASQSPYTELFVASVNWLRDRPPAAAVAAKTYGEYRPAKTIAFASAFWLPVGGLLVVVIFLGLGVWSYRRK